MTYYLFFYPIFRMLFIFCNYLQGMNEIIGPLYNVFASDTNEQWQSKFFTSYNTYI